jgi:hypothetical protein
MPPSHGEKPVVPSVSQPERNAQVMIFMQSSLLPNSVAGSSGFER